MKINQTIAQKALQRTSDIIDNVGPRLSGTTSCLDTADLLYNDMDTFTDSTAKEHFILHQGAFLGWIRILVSSYALGVLFLWLNMPLITMILLTLSILILVFQFFLYKPLIDFLYPKKSGCNVIGTIEPLGEVKEQIIISGHHDSARIFNFLIYQPKLYDLRVTGGIFLVIFLLLVSVFAFFLPSTIFTLILKIFVSIGFLLTGQMWFFASNKGTPGAGDNLISSSMAIELGRYFSEHKLQNTRIIIASFDAEEEGLRGARAYAKAHQEEFTQIPTTLLNVDCPYHLKDIFCLTTDLNGSVPLSQELATELVAIAHEKQYPAKHQPIAFLTGGTDAAELAKVGVKATTLLAMPWSNSERSSVYHTPQDTIDSIETEAVEAIVDIFMEYIQKQDSKTL